MLKRQFWARAVRHKSMFVNVLALLLSLQLVHATRASAQDLEAVAIPEAIAAAQVIVPVQAFSSGSKIIAATGGAFVRNENFSTVRWIQEPGVHGVIVGSSTYHSAGGFTGNWWHVSWDSAPPSYEGTSSSDWVAESGLLAASASGDILKPNLFGVNYATSANRFFPTYAPRDVGGCCEIEPIAKGNCTWYAHGRMLELGYSKAELLKIAPVGNGNANKWTQNAIANGITVNSTPAVGAIANYVGGSLGHVAIVEALHSDGSITVSESSYVPNGSSPWDFQWHRRTLKPLTGDTPFANFIHVSRSSSPVAPTPTDPINSIVTNTLTPTLTWSGGSNFGSLQVNVSKYPYGQDNLVHTTVGYFAPGVLTEVVPSGKLTSHTNYRWDITAFSGANGTGSFVRSDNAFFSTGATSNPTLSVSPATGLTASGPAGGSFSPPSITYTLTNTGTSSLSWSATPSNTSVATVSPLSSTLTQGQSVTVTVAVAGASLAASATPYTSTISFANNSGGAGATTRTVNLTVNGSTQTAKAVMSSPTPGTTLTGSSQIFQWSAGTGVSGYRLLVGASAGGGEYFGQSLSGTSATVVGLPTNGQTIHATLQSNINGSWQSAAYTYTAYTAAATGVKAVMSSPSPGSTLASSSQAFSWTAGTNATDYWLDVGTTAGGREIYGAISNGARSATVTGLPTNGSTIYVRLWSKLSSGWAGNYIDYTYTASTAVAGAKAVMISPTPNTTLTGSSQAFSWSTGTGVSQYWLQVGSSSGATDLYYQSTGSSVTTTVTGLPTNGQALYVRLWSLISGAWQVNDYTYTAATVSAGAKAVMTSPGNGATLTGSSQAFSWSTGTGVSQYWLQVGSSSGATDLYYQSTGSSLTAIVTGLPTNGQTLYVRLWSLLSSGWQVNDYTYTAATLSAGVKAVMSSPVNGATLAGSSQTFSWSTGTGVSQYWLQVGSSSGATDLYYQSTGSSLTTTVTGLPTNGQTLYVRLWSLLSSGWQVNDYTYTAATVSAGAKAVMTSPLSGATLAGSSQTFSWSTGTGVSQYWLQVGSSSGATDLYYQSTGTSQSATVTGLPTNGQTLYVRLWSLISGSWQVNDYTYTAATVSAGAKAVMTSPSNGATLTGSSQSFSWSTGTGVSQYWLQVGSSSGATDLYYQSTGTSTATTVGGLPTDGRTLYVRLWSQISGDWQVNDYNYTAATVSGGAKAVMTSPTNGSRLAYQQNFYWTTGTNVSQYWMFIGTTPGGSEYLSSSMGTYPAAQITGFPSNGQTIYVRLFSLIGGSWQYNDYVYYNPYPGTALEGTTTAEQVPKLTVALR